MDLRLGGLTDRFALLPNVATSNSPPILLFFFTFHYKFGNSNCLFEDGLPNLASPVNRSLVIFSTTLLRL